ncbi:hypothetical protein P5V15_008316 [Pogonomyrmex californicus]
MAINSSWSLITNRWLHKPTWLHSVEDPTSRLVHWRLKLAEYEYNTEMVYKAGKMNVNADALSRNPVVQTLPLAGTREPPLETNESDSDEPLFDGPAPRNPRIPTAAENRKSNMAAREDNEINDNLDHPDEHTSETDTDDGVSECESDITENENLFDADNIPYRSHFLRIRDIRDSLVNRKDNLVVFVDVQGDPCDLESQILSKQKLLPELCDIIGRGKTYAS